MVWASCAVFEQNLNHFLSSILNFLLNTFFLKKREFLENFYFDKICSKIHKNELKYKLCTILEWDKCQQFADLIKFGIYRFSLTQLCKTFVPFFMNKTLHKYIQSFVIKCLLLFLMKFHRILYIASFYGKIDLPNYKVVLK